MISPYSSDADLPSYMMLSLPEANWGIDWVGSAKAPHTSLFSTRSGMTW